MPPSPLTNRIHPPCPAIGQPTTKRASRRGAEGGDLRPSGDREERANNNARWMDRAVMQPRRSSGREYKCVIGYIQDFNRLHVWFLPGFFGDLQESGLT